MKRDFFQIHVYLMCFIISYNGLECIITFVNVSKLHSGCWLSELHFVSIIMLNVETFLSGPKNKMSRRNNNKNLLYDGKNKLFLLPW